MAGLERKWACFSILAYLAVSSTQSRPFREYGEVETVNGTFKFVGEPLDIYCNITSTTVLENSSMLYFERNSKKEKRGMVENIQILNTRSIKLHLSKLSVDDGGVYTCVQKTFSGDTRVIGSQIIEVDYKPQKVENMTCRVYNWESMNCSWDLGVQFKYPEYIHVSLAWTIELPPNSRSFSEQMDCPYPIGLTSCYWDAGKYTNGHMYLMVVEVSTKVKEKLLAMESSRIFRIETQLYVEPAPVGNFQVTVRNSSCVKLEWTHSAIGRDKFFVAENKVAAEDKWTLIILNEVLNATKIYHSLVCSLTPYTNYSFRMSVLPYPVETTEPVAQGHRSQWKEVTAQTWEDVPGAAPNICLGCFVEIRCPENIIARCVRLYWQDLKNNVKHGILTQYRITYSSINETKSNTTVDVPVNKSKLLSVDLRLPRADQTFKININPATSVGFSRNSSLLLLPAVQKRPNPPPNFLVEVDKKRFGVDIIFYLSWAALNTDAKTGLKYSNVTIVWCLGYKHTKIAECKDDIHWTEVPADHVTYELKLAAAGLQHSDFLIGITAEVISDSQIVSSGIYWSTCTFYRNEQPQNAPKKVREASKHPDNGLMILWDKFECAEEDSFITEYLVKYCPSDEGTKCNEPEKTMNVSNSASEVTLDHLQGDTKYLVSVMAISSAGLGPSRTLLLKTVKSFPPDEEESQVMLIVGILLSILVSVATILLLVWCCLKRRKKIPKTINILYEEPMDISNKKNQGFQNRPLPKTPEEQHFYGSSACMNNHGSDKVKDNSSGSYSEDSVTSQSNLLSPNVKVNRDAPSAVSEKSRKRKHKSKAAKSDLTMELKLVLKDTSYSTNGTSVDTKNTITSEPKDATSQPDYCTLGDNDNCTSSHNNKLQSYDNCTSSQNNGIQSSKLESASDKLSSSNTTQSSSDRVADYHKLASADLLDSKALNFSNTNTLPLRGQNMEMSICPVRLPLINPLSSSVLGDHGFVTELSQPAPQSSSYVESSKTPFPKFDPTKTAALNLPHADSLPHVNLPESTKSGYVAHSQITHQLSDVPENNQPLDYSRMAENLQNHTHDDSLESFLNFLPSSASSPPSPCPVDKCLPTYPASPPFLSHTQFKLPLYDTYVPDSAAMTPQHSLNNNNGYTTLDDFTKIAPVENLPPCSTCLTNGPSLNQTYNPSYAGNISLANNSVYVDNIPSIDNRNDNERPLVIGDYIYNPNVTATLPRNTSSDSATLQLPSPLSRPLSGDLLRLPLQYYEDPTLEGSNPTLTEL